MTTPDSGASGPNPAPKAGDSGSPAGPTPSSLPVNPGDTNVMPMQVNLPDVSGDVKKENPANKTSKLEAQTDEGKDDESGDEGKDEHGDDESGGDVGGGSGGDEKPPAPPSGGDDSSKAQQELIEILTSTLQHVASFTDGGKHAEDLDSMTRELTQAVNFLTMGPITDDGLERIKALLVQIVGPIEGLATRLKELKARDTLEKARNVMDKYRKFRGD